MRVRFNELFDVTDGMITPKVPIHINGITLSPGVSFSAGASFGGVDLSQWIGHDAEVEVDQQQEVNIIKGFY